MKDYDIYRNSLGEIPDFLNKYLNIDIINRLKDISLLCGMDYASKNAYSFKEYISRYDHSLDVALITWNLTHDKKQTLAGLFHDISTPVFSHVIDYMNKDFVKQESTEEKTREILNSSNSLKKCLRQDGLTLDDICDFKVYSIVDLDRPFMCADRLDGTILTAMNWTQTITGFNARNIVGNLMITNNEIGKNEIAFRNVSSAIEFTNINDEVNMATHSSKDNYMMCLLSDIVKLTIDLGIVDYDSLYYITEHEYIECIEDNLDLSDDLKNKWYLFKNIEIIPEEKNIKVKNKIINPLVVDKRLK